MDSRKSKLPCDLCGEWRICTTYQGKFVLCPECATKLTQDLVDDHYDPEEGVVVMRFNFERIDPHKVYEQRYKGCEDRNPAILTKMREGYRTVESLSKVLQWPTQSVQDAIKDMVNNGVAYYDGVYFWPVMPF